MGFSPQVPVRRAGGARRGRDRDVAGADLGEGTRLAAASGAWICFEDEAGQNLRPPKARTWAGAWANMKNGLGNLAVRDVDQLAAIMKSRLKRIQYRVALIEAFLAQTGLILESQPP
jgi:hypothetical protein